MGHIKKKELNDPNHSAPSFVTFSVLLANSLIILFIYVFSAFPSIPGGDSGELLSEACLMGTAHPPGYPLFTVVMHLLFRFTHAASKAAAPATAIGIPTFAWKANILSCIFGAGSVFCSSVASDLWMRITWGQSCAWVAAMGGALFALMPLTWEYTIGAEVFSLNNFLVALFLMLTVRAFAYGGRLIDVSLAALSCGLALSNQHTAALFQAVLIPGVVFATVRGKKLTVAAVFTAVFAFGLGLSPYIYLWVASQEQKPGSWGNFQHLQSLFHHVLRKEYGTFKLGVGKGESESMLQRILIYFMDTSDQTLYILPFLGAIGMVYTVLGLPSRTRALSFFMLGAFVFYQLFWNGILANLPLNAPMPKAVQSRFWIQPNLLLSMFASFGAGTVVCGSSIAKYKVSRAFGFLMWLTTIVLLVWKRKDQMGAWRENWHMHQYGEASLSRLPTGSLVVAHTDLDWNTVRYLRSCEGLRSDITHLTFQLMPFPWFPRQAKLYKNVTFPPPFEGVSTNKLSHGNAFLVYKFLDLNVDRFPATYIDMQAVNEADIETGGLWHDGFHLVPSGNLYRVYRALPNELQAGKWADQISEDLELFERVMKTPSHLYFPPGSWEYAALSVYWDAHYQAGLFFLTWGLALSRTLDEKSLPAYAIALEKASRLLLATLDAWDKHQALSSGYSDLLKNTVLCIVRAHGTLEVMEQFKDKLVMPSGITFRSEKAARSYAIKLTKRFLAEVPGDKDAKVFEDYLSKLQQKGPRKNEAADEPTNVTSNKTNETQNKSKKKTSKKQKNKKKKVEL